MDESTSHWRGASADAPTPAEAAQPAPAADLAPTDPQARLAAIRKEIDSVDGQLLTLCNRRAALSLEVGRIKAHVPGIIFKPLREKEVLDGLAAQNPGPLPEDHLRAIWREIFSSSRALQRPQNVAYLGPEGTFSYFAGVEYLGHAAQFHPCNDLAEVFEEVASGQCELGVVPLENSLQGTVGVSFDLFLKHEVYIQAELFSRISHCLLSNAPSLAAVRTVYSHPQPLAQCGVWLRAHLPGAALVPVESTAAAAQRAAAQPDAAAIGHGKLADLLGLGVLARRIENEPGQLDALCYHRPRQRPPRRPPQRSPARPYRRGQDLPALHHSGQGRGAFQCAGPHGRPRREHAQAGIPPSARPVLEVRLFCGCGMRPARPALRRAADQAARGLHQLPHFGQLPHGPATGPPGPQRHRTGVLIS